jgi:hypothetical protein
VTEATPRRKQRRVSSFGRLREGASGNMHDLEALEEELNRLAEKRAEGAEEAERRRQEELGAELGYLADHEAHRRGLWVAHHRRQARIHEALAEHHRRAAEELLNVNPMDRRNGHAG